MLSAGRYRAVFALCQIGSRTKLVKSQVQKQAFSHSAIYRADNRLTDKKKQKKAAQRNLERCLQSGNNDSKYKGCKMHSVYLRMFACENES